MACQKDDAECPGAADGRATAADEIAWRRQPKGVPVSGRNPSRHPYSLPARPRQLFEA